MDETKFYAMCEQIKGIVTGIQGRRVRAAAVIGCLEGTAKLDPGRTYSTDQFIRIIELICPEIEQTPM